MFRYLTAGESHGPGLVATVEGLPAGLEVTGDGIGAELARRRLGFGRGARMRVEQDQLEILAGVRHGKTLGSPVAVMGRGIQEQLSRAVWEGNRLVITTKQPFPHPDTGAPMSIEVKRVLSLTSPDSLTVETTRSGVLGGPSSTTTTVYRRIQ